MGHIGYFLMLHPDWNYADNIVYIVTCIIVCAYCIKHWNDTRR